MATSSLDLVTADVGVRHFALAAFDGGVLAAAAFIDEPPLFGGAVTMIQWAKRAKHVIIEKPKVYDAQHQKGDQRDIRDLAMSAGGLVVAARMFRGECVDDGFVATVEPREWKGTVDKKVMLARIYSHVSMVERTCIQLSEKSLQAGIKSGKGPGADVLDAIGIGLWKLGRLNKGRTR